MSSAARIVLTAALVAVAVPMARGEETTPPLPTLRMVLFTPSDVEPPAGVRRRITQIADYTERFFLRWMTHWKYEPARKAIFRRGGDGGAEVLFVKGEQPFSSGRYDGPGFQQEVIEKAVRQGKIPRRRHVWWIYVYLGDPPRRFRDFRGEGDSRNGGWSLMNYPTAPGDIRPEDELGGGFLEAIALKGGIHELGHALGLPHIGPNPGKKLGNSLMGPTIENYARQLGRGDRRVYLTEAGAAMLWKHPLFSGTDRDRAVMPSVELKDYRGRYDPRRRLVELVGKLSSNSRAHSVVVIDNMKQKPGTYWMRSYAARLADDGTFRVSVDEPVPSDGQYEIYFCFENGVVTGDGKGQSEKSALVKPYRFGRGGFEFTK
jgi:hypothetical protein